MLVQACPGVDSMKALKSKGSTMPHVSGLTLEQPRDTLWPWAGGSGIQVKTLHQPSAGRKSSQASDGIAPGFNITYGNAHRESKGSRSALAIPSMVP